MRGDFHVRFCERFVVRFHLPTRRNQKSTQKKYLLQQIAALQVYTGFLQKGYGIVHSGLNTIRDITDGEFKLHTAYISSLAQVNPVIRNDKRVNAMISMQTEIVDAFNSIKNGVLSADNQAYVNEVRQLALSDCSKDLEELELVITSGKVQMMDDERLERLGKVYDRTLDKYAFTQHFANEVSMMILQSTGEQQDIKSLRRYYDTN